MWLRLRTTVKKRSELEVEMSFANWNLERYPTFHRYRPAIGNSEPDKNCGGESVAWVRRRVWKRETPYLAL